ncbi:unnamed protein product [Caenorhabditis auriculariae]|uniref:Uncharacterized protein n=1 Tax=Caenorhabditis auriculariae TaxID=2777116 RepID=A0A8S1HFZ1_9PELO|nr:unnamed protein product [Caenorhabditis auriculariae]
MTNNDANRFRKERKSSGAGITERRDVSAHVVPSRTTFVEGGIAVIRYVIPIASPPMASSTKRRYGTYGRAITSPALLSSSVAWTRPSETTPGRFSMKTTSATPPPTSSGSAPRHEYATPNVTGFTARPPADPKQRSRVERLRQRISDRRTSAYMAPNQVFAESKESGDTSIQDLMNKYLKKKTPEKEMGRKSREVSSIKENHLKASDSRDSSPSIDALMKRYGSNGSSHRIRDSTLSRRESLEANGSVGSVDRNSSNKIPLNQSCREARLSGSDVKNQVGGQQRSSAANFGQEIQRRHRSRTNIYPFPGSFQSSFEV